MYMYMPVCNTAQFMYTSNFHSYIMSSSGWIRIPCGCGSGGMCCLNPALCCDSTCVDSLEKMVTEELNSACICIYTLMFAFTLLYLPQEDKKG